jgi:hypothetical protein
VGDRVTHVRSLDLGGRLSRFHQPPRLPSSHSMRRYTVSSSQCSHPGPGHSNALDALVMLLPRNPWWNEAGKVRHLHLNWPRGSPATSKRRYGQPMTRCITTERVIFIYCYRCFFQKLNITVYNPDSQTSTVAFLETCFSIFSISMVTQ